MAVSSRDAIAQLVAPGAPFEMSEQIIRGIATRAWKSMPANLRAVLETSRAHGDLPFLIYEGEILSFEQHFQACAALAITLRDRMGVRKGDRVAIAMRNLPEWSISFFAAAVIGAIVVPLNGWLTGAELNYCLVDSGSTTLIADGERLERLESFRTELKQGGLTTIIVTHQTADLEEGDYRWADAVSSAAPAMALPDISIDPDDDATIFYTSGTTGKPRGALGTHRNICSSPVSIAFGRARAQLLAGRPLAPAGAAPKRTILLPVPLFHATGCHGALMSNILAGNKVVLMRRWDTEDAMKIIAAERVNAITGVPTLGWQIVQHPNVDLYDLSSLEQLSLGGAPLAPELLKRVKARLPQTGVTNGYGLTESSAAISQNVGIESLDRPDSIGLPIAVCDLRIVDADGGEAPRGTAGELWVRGPNIVKGYWKRAGTPDLFADGWLRTGDIVREDEDGFLFLLDRVKDVIIRGGENIYTVEVEEVLMRHPDVLDVAVIGRHHDVLGEEVIAIVQLARGADVDEEALRGHVAQHLAGFKVPAHVEIRDAPLPRNATGKIVKNAL